MSYPHSTSDRLLRSLRFLWADPPWFEFENLLILLTFVVSYEESSIVLGRMMVSAVNMLADQLFFLSLRSSPLEDNDPLKCG